jgi:hypothetical protein
MKYDLEKERLWFRRQSCAVSSWASSGSLLPVQVRCKGGRWPAGERKEMRMTTWMNKKIKIKCHFAYISITTEGVWTQLVQLNKSRVLNFDFATLWT